VTGVGRSGSVIARDRTRESRVRDRSRKAAVPDSLKLAVPAGTRHPHFELDIRIDGWFDHAGDAAESGQFLERSGDSGWRSECAGVHRLRRRDRRVCQLETRELLTGLCVRTCGTYAEGGEQNSKATPNQSSPSRVVIHVLSLRISSFYRNPRARIAKQRAEYKNVRGGL